HPDTISAMGNVAHTTSWEIWQEAEEFEVLVLKKWTDILGDNCPNTLIAMSNLAVRYNKLGRWQEAEELGFSALKKLMDGEKHQWTLETMQNLAVTYDKLGKLKEAEDL
ncbi:hypothetical protein C8R44DRAFT_579488, partial [Mycena epipterygia]